MTDLKIAIENSIKASRDFQSLMSGVMPALMFGTEEFLDSSANPNVQATKTESLHVLNGALIVYLFSMWDNYFDSDMPGKYFREDEKLMYY